MVRVTFAQQLHQGGWGHKTFANISNSGPIRSMKEMLGCNRAGCGTGKCGGVVVGGRTFVSRESVLQKVCPREAPSTVPQAPSITVDKTHALSLLCLIFDSNIITSQVKLYKPAVSKQVRARAPNVVVGCRWKGFWV